ncbi:MAG: OpgC domain-containing protein, partial [Acetobacteraceae bacterium]|nr:OpgC domain-containing protein [Acetobacteraceae bacterium]
MFDFRLIPLAPPDKTTLSALRLLHILAMAYLALSSARMRDLAQRPILAPVVACGRHSLEVFTAGTLLSLIGRLIFRTYGAGWAVQVAVNAVGLAAMVALALMLERARARARARVTAPAAPRPLRPGGARPRPSAP